MQPVQSNAGSYAREQGERTPRNDSSAAQPAIQKVSLPRRSIVVTTAAAAIWLCSIVLALVLIARYSNAPGPRGAIPRYWPSRSFILPDADRPTLIMFAHPHCPCTRVSLGELDRLMARCRGQFSAHVVFVKPAGLQEDLFQSELWRLASAIPGVKVYEDSSGHETRCFRPETSGQTMLYDHDGRLLFQGGITLARGHAGDNAGRSALIALLNHDLVNKVETPVYGCSLFEPGDAKDTLP